MANVIKYEFTRVEPQLYRSGNTGGHTADTVCKCVIGCTATEYLSDGTTLTGESEYIDILVDVSGCPTLTDFTNNSLISLCNDTANANNWKSTLAARINSVKDIPKNTTGWTKPTINFTATN